MLLTVNDKYFPQQVIPADPANSEDPLNSTLCKNMKIRNKIHVILIISISILISCKNLIFAELMAPGMYFYPKGANEYLIQLLKENKIPYEIEYDNKRNIQLIRWSDKDNRKALEQALKVNHKIGATKRPESIKMLSPEMNDKFERLLKENNIPFERKGDATFYEWKYWVEVELLKRKFWGQELGN